MREDFRPAIRRALNAASLFDLERFLGTRCFARSLPLPALKAHQRAADKLQRSSWKRCQADSSNVVWLRHLVHAERAYTLRLEIRKRKPHTRKRRPK